MATIENSNQEISRSPKQEIDVSQGEPTFEGQFYSFKADIVENNEAVTVIADMPGVDPQGLEIDLRDNVLTIVGRVEPIAEKWRAVHHEYSIGGYLRRFNVGPAIDQEKISANLKDGVLTLMLPKAERLRPRKIEVISA